MAWSRMPWDRTYLNVNVHTVDEPPCVGHSDYMCTVTTGDPMTGFQHDIYIRSGADDPKANFNAGVTDDLHNFFAECFIHELGHAFVKQYMAPDSGSQTVVCSWFYLETATGEGRARRGVLTDWDGTDKKWEDRITEAIAEFFKDVYLPDSHRVYENRTNWWMDEAHFPEFVQIVESIVCTGGGGGT